MNKEVEAGGVSAFNWRQTSGVMVARESVESRQCRALERIAAALERLAPPVIAPNSEDVK